MNRRLGSAFLALTSFTGCGALGNTPSQSRYTRQRIHGVDCIVYHDVNEGGLSCDWTNATTTSVGGER